MHSRGGIVPSVTLLLLAGAAAMLSSCSTTRVLQQGEYRLEKNVITIEGDPDFRDPDLESYIRQQPNGALLFGWNPLLNIYNLSGQDADKWINKVIRSMGEAPVVYDPDLVQVSADNIRNHLEYIGYFGSTVDGYPEEPNGRRVKVRYDIRLGRRYPIRSISYDLPKRGRFAEDFYRDTARISIHPGSFLSESSLASESERSARYFRNRGYYGFSQANYVFTADTLTTPGVADLTYQVLEHSRSDMETSGRVDEPLRRHFFHNVSISCPEDMPFREKMLRKLNGIIPGNPYSEIVVSNTYARLSAIRYFNSVNIQMNPVDTAGVDCVIQIRPSNPRGIRFNIEASTNSTGLVGLSPQIGFYHKNIFHGGEWFNLGIMGNFQMRVGKNLKIDRSVRSTEFGVSTSISFPKLLGFPLARFRGRSVPRTDVALSYNYQDRPEYTRNILSTSFAYAGSYRRLYYQITPLQLSMVRLFDVKDSFQASMQGNPFLYNAYQDHFDAGASMMLYHTTNTDVNPTTSYQYWRLQIDASGNVLALAKPLMKKDAQGAGTIWDTPFAQYVRAEASLGRTWTFGEGDRSAIATRLLGGIGYAYGNSTTLPFEKQFYAGGANSLRGWQARSVGPGNGEMNKTFVIPNQTGDIRLEANLEYRFPLFWRLRGALFTDVGNVWNTFETATDAAAVLTLDNLARSLALSWGTGVRVDLSYILLRVDLGFRLHDPAREAGARWCKPNQWFDANGYAIHFGVGYPF